jgi:hypothetical protein
MHRGGDSDLTDLQWRNRPWNGAQAYSDSKLFDVVLAFAVARLWPGALSNAVDPGWVATKMGGPGAPDDITQGAETQVWLAVSDDPRALVSGRYFHHEQIRTPTRPLQTSTSRTACCAPVNISPAPRSLRKDRRLAMGSGGVAILPGVVAGGLLDYVAQHSDRLDAFILRTRRQNLS